MRVVSSTGGRSLAERKYIHLMQHLSILRTCRNWWPSSRGVCDKCGYGARFCWAGPCRKADSGSAPSARRGGGESAGGGCCAPWSPRRTAGRRKSRSATPAPYCRSDSPPPRLCTALKENGMQQVRQDRRWTNEYATLSLSDAHSNSSSGAKSKDVKGFRCQGNYGLY